MWFRQGLPEQKTQVTHKLTRRPASKPLAKELALRDFGHCPPSLLPSRRRRTKSGRVRQPPCRKIRRQTAAAAAPSALVPLSPLRRHLHRRRPLRQGRQQHCHHCPSCLHSGCYRSRPPRCATAFTGPPLLRPGLESVSNLACLSQQGASASDAREWASQRGRDYKQGSVAIK